MADTSLQTVPLGHGFELDCSFPSLDAVDIALQFRRRRLWMLHFDADNPGPRHTVNLGLVRLSFRVDSDMFDGEVSWSFELAVRNVRTGSWRTVVNRSRRVLLRFDPSLGEVGRSTAVHPPEVDDPRFGKSQTCTPTILRIHVDDEKRELCDVGRVVKQTMFPDHPPFVFNTVACVGAFTVGDPGPYTDPLSIWFNTFLGYYELDCDRALWTRPFGYQTADGSASLPEPEDLARLGKSDWNWFSNWDYGVPAAAALEYSGVNMKDIGFVNNGLVTIGRTRWHHVELRGAEVASCYVSDAAGASQLVQNTIIDEVWRRSFGAPTPRPDYPESFIPTVVDAVVDMAYWEDETTFHTVLFGGTAKVGSDPDFLPTQLQATRAVIATDYPDLGFR